ncbi:MAG: hypothetical protein KBC91_03565 [Candidatus Omnitrophica bacterium]|nr:hypothetical protein [Candidatus Omnitrophota bacterium]
MNKMNRWIAFVFLAFFAFGFSKTVLAEVVPAVPAVAQEDIVVVFDDEFLQQQVR